MCVTLGWAQLALKQANISEYQPVQESASLFAAETENEQMQ